MILVKKFTKEHNYLLSSEEEPQIEDQINKWIKENHVEIKDIKYDYNPTTFRETALVIYDDMIVTIDPKQVLKEARLKNEFTKEIFKRDILLKKYSDTVVENIFKLDVSPEILEKFTQLNEEYLDLIAKEKREI